MTIGSEIVIHIYLCTQARIEENILISKIVVNYESGMKLLVYVEVLD
jgi:hypothetical protein